MRRLCACVAVLAAASSFGMAAASAVAAQWLSAAQSPSDNRTQPYELAISSGNVSRLKPKWTFTTHGDVSVTPTINGGAVYFPDAAGYLYALQASTGALIWEQQISTYDGASGAISRSSPVIDGNELILGDNVPGLHSSGAQVFAVNAATGALLWDTQVESHPASHITGSPVVANGAVIVGVSSGEEGAATSASYPCCTFRGSVVALNATTGAILWKTYTVPPNGGPCTSSDPPAGCGYSGGAVWSDPAVNLLTNTIYVGTGNNYTAPDAAVACEQLALANNTSDADCTAPNDYFDALVALNLRTGAVLWGAKVEGWDATNVACVVPPGTTWCPSPASPDFDFGSGPNIYRAKTASGSIVSLVGMGQKSGIYWAFNQTTGAPAWNTLVGPGSSLGGVMWGTATDGTTIWVPDANPFHTSFTLTNGQSATGGAWSALSAASGQILWQTAAPGGAAAMGPVSEANGVVYAGSTAPTGANMFALNAATGQILWSFASGGSTVSSPAIAGGNVYWGSGYSELSLLGYAGNHRFYDFTVGGH